MDYTFREQNGIVIVEVDGVEKFRYSKVNPVVPQLIRFILKLMEEK